MPQLEFSKQSNPGRFAHDGPLRLINGYSEDVPDFGTVFYASPGLAAFATGPNKGPWQGLLDVDGVMYGVVNRQIFSITQAGKMTYIGGWPADGPVTITRNRQLPYPQITIAGSEIWGFIQNGVWTLGDNPNLPGPNSVTTGDGFAFFGIPTGQVFASAIDDVTSIDALAVATASALPDTLVRVYSRGSDLIVFCAAHTEFWADNGGNPFPYAPIPGTSMKIGAVGAGAVIEISVEDRDTAVFWVANDNTVRRLQGYTGQTVSNPAVERAIAATTDKTLITATGYVVPGHSFLTVSGPGWSWELDVGTGFWHERQSYGLTNWRVSQIAKFSALGCYVAGDDITGALYKLDPAALDEAGAPLVWTARALAKQYPMRLEGLALYLDPIPGTGLNSTDPDDADPQLVLRWSKDNGLTWSPERQLSTGKIGEAAKRVKTRRLGVSEENGFLFEIRMGARVVKGITGGFLEAKALPV